MLSLSPCTLQSRPLRPVPRDIGAPAAECRDLALPGAQERLAQHAEHDRAVLRARPCRSQSPGGSLCSTLASPPIGTSQTSSGDARALARACAASPDAGRRSTRADSTARSRPRARTSRRRRAGSGLSSSPRISVPLTASNVVFHRAQRSAFDPGAGLAVQRARDVLGVGDHAAAAGARLHEAERAPRSSAPCCRRRSGPRRRSARPRATVIRVEPLLVGLAEADRHALDAGRESSAARPSSRSRAAPRRGPCR